MNILITGANGFIGKNLIAQLRNESAIDEIYTYDINTDPYLLDDYCKDADFVYNLAGINRPIDQSEFMKGNYEFIFTLLETLKKYKNDCPIMLASSIQAVLDNPYGKSKKSGEDLMLEYSKETGAKVLIYRFPNVFGKWCKPNYNSVIATFCYNICHDLPIGVDDPNHFMKLAYIDDVVEELIRAKKGKENRKDDFCEIPIVYNVTLGEIASQIYSFRDSRIYLTIPKVSDEFTKKLYSTYLTYLKEDGFCYELKMNIDNRGSFTEFIKTADRGQISVNIAKAGIIKGNHWHHTKHEKFLVVSGSGVIRLRNIYSDKVLEYFVTDEKMEVVDIPPGYTHNIENIGKTDMVTIMWANESFNRDKPDTYNMEVSIKR